MAPSLPSPPAASWLAAVHNPPARVILAEVGRGTRAFLAAIFWRSPWSGPLPPGLRAAAAAALSGLAQGLPASNLGQSFAWPYLLGWPGAALPGVTPALRCAGLLGGAAGLALLLRRPWRAALAGAGLVPDRGAARHSPELASVAAAAVPAFALAWLLRGLTATLQAPATVGLCLAATAELVVLGARWARREVQVGDAVPPWAAFCAGIACGAAALPGISRLAVLLLGALAARARPAAAGRFALMAAAATSGLLGLAALPGALAGPGGQVLFLPAAALAAALGACAGGWLLLRWLDAEEGAFALLASAVAALGGLLLLLGVFGA